MFPLQRYSATIGCSVSEMYRIGCLFPLGSHNIVAILATEQCCNATLFKLVHFCSVSFLLRFTGVKTDILLVETYETVREWKRFPGFVIIHQLFSTFMTSLLGSLKVSAVVCGVFFCSSVATLRNYSCKIVSSRNFC